MTAAAPNAVPVDELAAVAELEAIAAGADRDAAAELEASTAAELEAAGHDPAAWMKAAELVADVFSGQCVPNWELDGNDRSSIARELAAVLDHYFPGGPSGVDNWHPLYRLVFALGGITITRGVDWQHGALKPLRKPDPKKPPATSPATIEASTDGANDGEAAERVAVVPDGQDAQRQVAKRFSMGGG